MKEEIIMREQEIKRLLHQADDRQLEQIAVYPATNDKTKKQLYRVLRIRRTAPAGDAVTEIFQAQEPERIGWHRFVLAVASITVCAMAVAGIVTVTRMTPPGNMEASVRIPADAAYSRQVTTEPLSIRLPGTLSELFETAEGFGAFCFPADGSAVHFVTFSQDLSTCKDTPLTLPVQEGLDAAAGAYVYSDGKILALINDGGSWGIYTCSTDGKLLHHAKVSGCEEVLSDSVPQTGQLFVDAGTVYYLQNTGTLLTLDPKDGTADMRYQAEDTKYERDMEKKLCRDRDGQVLLSSTGYVYQKQTLRWRYTGSVCAYDLTTGVCGEMILQNWDDYGEEVSSYAAPGFGKYRILLQNWQGIEGLNAAGEGDGLIGWAESGIPEMEVYPVDGVHFFGSVQTGAETECYLLTRIQASQLQEVTKLTVRTIGDSDKLQEFAAQYHLSHPDIYVEIIEDTERSTDAFRTELLSQETADIVIFRDHSEVAALDEYGIFLDMHSFLDSDPGFVRFDPDVLAALEAPDGRLYSLPADGAEITIVTRRNMEETWAFLRAYLKDRSSEASTK